MNIILYYPENGRILELSISEIDFISFDELFWRSGLFSILNQLAILWPTVKNVNKDYLLM